MNICKIQPKDHTIQAHTIIARFIGVFANFNVTRYSQTMNRKLQEQIIEAFSRPEVWKDKWAKQPEVRPPLPPKPVPIREHKGTLYLREGGLNMPTLCPKSMSWLLYFKGMKSAFLEFGFEIEYTNDDDNVPRFETAQGQTYSDLEVFSAENNSLDPKRTNEQDPKKIRDEEAVIALVKERKGCMRQHLINLENAFVYGFSCLNIPDAQWVSNTVNDIKQSLRIDDDEQLQELLMQNSENAFRSLSDILGYNAYFLEDLRKAFDEKNKEAGHDESDLFGHCVGVSSLTILDAKTAAICMLIVRCFDHESQPECYNSKLKITLFRHLTLWSQASRVYTFYIKEKQLTDFTTTFTENPSLLARVVNSGQPQATGNFGFVYRIYLPTDDNEWNLKAGAYALNVSKTSRCNFHLEAESRFLPDVQYAYVIKLLGTGYAELSGETVMVLVTEWVPGGDLESKMNGLKWDQVKHILKVLAYALYTVHRTGNTCLCDLKPANILLDEYHNPIICDLGATCTSKERVTCSSSPYRHSDDDKDASYAHDVFSFGIILFQLLMEVERDDGEKVAGRIASYIYGGGNQYALVKPQLKESGCQENIARELLKLGLKCTSDIGNRASDLEVLEDLERMFGYEIVNCLLF